MRMIKTMLAGAAGLAALAVAAPASAQYYPYGYSNYGYSNYGYNNAYNGYGYNTYAASTAMAQQQCTAAVQNRLYNRTSLGEILGSLVGLPTASQGRVLSITRVDPDRNRIHVRGLATSGRFAYNNYGPYGVGAYGALGYGYQPDLEFRCNVDYRGYVRDVDIRRR